ncbi:aldo/keto reductase [Amycolatopsis sp. NPDC023774]|uniref:aldo/keto reductase n=1 Tax=Amycolatopsis sp. NPDC023774 TaxID=3155015 RepID=UPI0033E30799
METSSLGDTGVEVTRFVYGAGSIGGIGGAATTRGLGIDSADGLRRLNEAYDLGIRTIDTADSYGGGESERTVGRWLAEQPRDDVVVLTKVGGIVRPDQTDVDLSGPHVERQLAESIRRLGCVDLYLSHAPDPRTPIEETLTAFAAAREAGLIRAYGVSNVDAGLLDAILDVAAKRSLPRPACVQNGLSLLNRADERDLLPLAAAEGIGYLAYSPLAGGVLSDRYLDGTAPGPGSRIALAGDRYYAGMHSAENLIRVGALRDLARDNGISTAGLALAWLLAHPAVTAPVVSPSAETQWQAIREAVGADLDDTLFAAVSAVFSGHP